MRLLHVLLALAASVVFAKGLAFGGEAEEPVVLVTVDNCGVPSAVRDEVVRCLATKTKIVSDRFVVKLKEASGR